MKLDNRIILLANGAEDSNRFTRICEQITAAFLLDTSQSVVNVPLTIPQSWGTTRQQIIRL